MTHLSDLKMTYFEHLWGALGYSVQAFSAGFVFMLHGIFPECCVYTGSNIIHDLNNKVQTKKSINV
jgi:hypothetical protein